MTEMMTASTGTTRVFGKKAFKYISSAVYRQFRHGTNLSLGISDVMGLSFKADYVQQLEYWAGNTASLNNVGFSAASMVAASNTTLDVRGVLQLSGIGGGTPLTNPATTNNVLRFTVAHDIPLYAMVNTTPNSLLQLFGTTQA